MQVADYRKGMSGERMGYPQKALQVVEGYGREADAITHYTKTEGGLVSSHQGHS
jgi:hypothetical protein